MVRAFALAASVVLTACAGEVAPSDPAEPLTCHAELWDGGPVIGAHAAPDGGPVLCPEGADEGDPCIVPLPTIDHPSGYGYPGTCE